MWPFKKKRNSKYTGIDALRGSALNVPYRETELIPRQTHYRMFEKTAYGERDEVKFRSKRKFKRKFIKKKYLSHWEEYRHQNNDIIIILKFSDDLLETIDYRPSFSEPVTSLSFLQAKKDFHRVFETSLSLGEHVSEFTQLWVTADDHENWLRIKDDA